MLKTLALVAALLTVADARKYNTTSKRLRGVVNVHLVPHTHDDVGWLKTVDQYYYGNRNDIQRATVQNIINSVLKELAWNADRKFIYIEQAFYQRYMEEHQDDPQIMSLMRQLISQGQLEFINGGWCMHDEASPSFVDMIDQTTLGHRYLLQQFNVTPKTTWQIDPFGHSSNAASLLSSPMAGFNGVHFMRADYQEIGQRNDARTTEWIWAASPTKGMNTATFASVIYGGYCTIGGINMDIYSSDAPVMDDITLEDYNVGQVVEAVVNAAFDNIKKYPQGEPGGDGTMDVLLPLGCDFNYENAGTWFTNTDKVIHWLNQDGRVNAFYSTPSIYTAAKLENGKSYTVRTGDMFPYADGPHAYWTGYFVSRAALKGYVRDTSSVFQAAKQIQAFTGGAQDMSSTNPLYRLERALGVTQHHDAVAGTAKQAVAYDYARRLAWGREDADALFNASFQKLTKFTTGSFYSCDLSNVTICPALEAAVPTVAILYNQQAQTRPAWNVLLPVGLPTGIVSYSVFDNNNKPVTAQLFPLSSRDTSLRTEYYNDNSTVPIQWLAFQANLPATGFSAYFIIPTGSTEEAPFTHISTPITMRIGNNGLRSATRKTKNVVEGDQQITNGVVTVTIDGNTGLVSNYANSNNGINTPLSQNFYWYNSSVGNKQDGQASGAYIFRPNSSTIFNVGTGSATVTIINGPIINEARQVFATWMTQSVRLWAGAPTADFEMTVGPIPFQDGLGKEIITRYTTNFATNSTWYTDSNGRDTMTRIYNYRSQWNYTVEEPVSGNYYPVNAYIYTQDVNNGNTLSVMTDRSQAGASVVNGTFEVMIQRRLQHDDSRGVGEPLNETGLDGNGLIIRTLHRLSVDNTPANAAVSRRTALADLMYRLTPRFSALPAGMTVAQWLQSYQGSYTALTAPLPPNVHLLTVHSWGPKQLLLRVSHSYEANEGGNMANDVQVNLASIFAPSSGIVLQSCTEMTVTGNQPLASAPKWTYNVTGGPVVTLPIVPSAPQGAQMTITLSAMDVRTYMCTLQ